MNSILFIAAWAIVGISIGGLIVVFKNRAKK